MNKPDSLALAKALAVLTRHMGTFSLDGQKAVCDTLMASWEDGVAVAKQAQLSHDSHLAALSAAYDALVEPGIPMQPVWAIPPALDAEVAEMRHLFADLTAQLPGVEAALDVHTHYMACTQCTVLSHLCPEGLRLERHAQEEIDRYSAAKEAEKRG